MTWGKKVMGSPLGNFKKVTLEDFSDCDIYDEMDNWSGFSCENVTFRREWRRNEAYWYAFKKINRKVVKVYCGWKFNFRPSFILYVKQQLLAKAGVTL